MHAIASPRLLHGTTQRIQYAASYVGQTGYDYAMCFANVFMTKHAGFPKLHCHERWVLNVLIHCFYISRTLLCGNGKTPPIPDKLAK